MRSFSTIEPVAEQRRPVELFQQRLRELLERVGQNDDLHQRAEFIEKFFSARQRLQRADDFLDVRELDAVLVEDPCAVAIAELNVATPFWSGTVSWYLVGRAG